MLIFSSLSLAAAESAVWTMLPIATTVTSLPSLLITASPSGIVYSSTGTSPFNPLRVNAKFSKKITGLSSLIADFNNPLAS